MEIQLVLLIKFLMKLLAIVKHCRKLVHLLAIHKNTKHTSIVVRLCKASLYSPGHREKTSEDKYPVQENNYVIDFTFFTC
jgi:hypothetical protein